MDRVKEKRHKQRKISLKPIHLIPNHHNHKKIVELLPLLNEWSHVFHTDNLRPTSTLKITCLFPHSTKIPCYIFEGGIYR